VPQKEVTQEGSRLSRGTDRISRGAIEKYFRACLAARTPPRISKLAKKLGVSRGTLVYSVTDLVGLVPSEYFRRLQIESAKKLLDRGWSISSVAVHAGFGTRRTFFRSFREATGKTPAAYRFEQNVTGRTRCKTTPGEFSGPQNEGFASSRRSW
jgi:AraC-like DNA-binding protein